MQHDLFETGLNQRKATLGAEYVEKNLAAADDFTRPFQEAMTDFRILVFQPGDSPFPQ